MAKAKKGDRVRIHFTGRLDDDTIFDSTVEHAECDLDDCECEIGPMELVIGEGEFFPQVEKALVGLAAGAKTNLVIKAEEAFGAYDEERVFVVEKSEFPKNITPEPGQNLELIDEEGDAIVVMVIDVDDTSVTLDANHPLAGEDLAFDVELLEIVTE